MMIPGYTIRTMTRHEIRLAVEWAAAEGWNPGLEDAECFYRADPDGFLVGLLDGEPTACISVVRYGNSFGFLGFYIVRPEYRGRGLGLAIWNAGLQRLGGRVVGLDGVVAQQENYRKSGFVLAYRNIRYMGVSSQNRENPREAVPLSSIPFEELAVCDREFFPDDRRDFLQCWTSRQQSRAFGVRRNGKLSGYGLIRPCRAGFKIGPLFADNTELAETLFGALESSVPEGSPIFLDIPEVNPAALKLVQRHEMSVVFETARMYKGPAPQLPVERIFGVTTFELG
ncbi:GNAT family N-acetyltransferase [Chlorobaculum sp. 24CR]|uniref:GNAT family N-acetyltransferase n=1 Tax=Chlorobaculum sp. 24CR TaxID=2508878 RepID=UPI00100A479C|nr:GNAT family N-acetyltransferase [Chlorobaculum sp. 24CR]RXK87520.1 GNAT family N-acetyltransferase [Chlorobaculum sp. 24CR]